MALSLRVRNRRRAEFQRAQREAEQHKHQWKMREWLAGGMNQNPSKEETLDKLKERC